jgi:hypothetical protein
VADVLFEFGGRTHIWKGGPDVAARLEAGRSDGLVMGADYSVVGVTRSWRLDAFDAGSPGVIFAVPDAATDPAMADRVAPIAAPLQLYDAASLAQPVMDAKRQPVRFRWWNGTQELWAVGDWDGNGLADLLVGSAAINQAGAFGVVYGPLVR